MAYLRKMGVKTRPVCGARRPGDLIVIRDNIYIKSKMQVPRDSWQRFSKSLRILPFAGDRAPPGGVRRGYQYCIKAPKRRLLTARITYHKIGEAQEKIDKFLLFTYFSVIWISSYHAGVMEIQIIFDNLQ
jgi:hypothetical protein